MGQVQPIIHNMVHKRARYRGLIGGDGDLLRQGQGKTAQTSTRATAGTVTDYEGIVRSIPAGYPRWEGGRWVQNLLRYSETLTDSSWIKTGSSIVNGALIESNALSAHSIREQGIILLGLNRPHVFYCDVSRAGRDTFGLHIINGDWNQSAYARFDLLNMVTSAAPASNQRYVASGIILLPGNVFRVWVRMTGFTSGTETIVYLKLTNNYDTMEEGYQGDGVSGIMIHRFQLEDITGSAYQLPSEYVPTAAASAGKWFFNHPTTQAPLSATMLMEGVGENKLLQSESLAITPWGATDRTTVLSDVISSPFGSITADKVMEVALASVPRIATNITTIIGTVYTFSIFSKAAERTQIRLVAEGSGGKSAYFDLSTGQVFSIGASCTANISSAMNGWYRCSITYTAAYTGSATYIATASSGNIISSGDASKGVYLWGAQFEASSVPTSYIPTTTSSVPRNADTLSWPLTDDLKAIFGKQGTVAIDFTPSYTQSAASGDVGIVSPSNAAKNLLYHDATAYLKGYDGTNTPTVSKTFVAGTNYKLAIRWSAAGFQVSIKDTSWTHGASSAFDGAFTLGTVLNLSYGNALPVKYGNLRVFPRYLTDAEMTRL